MLPGFGELAYIMDAGLLSSSRGFGQMINIAVDGDSAEIEAVVDYSEDLHDLKSGAMASAIKAKITAHSQDVVAVVAGTQIGISGRYWRTLNAPMIRDDNLAEFFVGDLEDEQPESDIRY